MVYMAVFSFYSEPSLHLARQDPHRLPLLPQTIIKGMSPLFARESAYILMPVAWLGVGGSALCVSMPVLIFASQM